MVEKKELKSKQKFKILIIGEAGTGKTRTCVQIAKTLADLGKKVLYIDMERGAINELLELSDQTLQNIIYKDVGHFDPLSTLIRDATNYDLIIIDPFHIVEIARREARKKFLSVGHFHMGEKEIKITEPEIFDLQGWLYAVPNRWTEDLLNELVHLPADIINVVMLPNKHYEEFLGKYDTVLHFKYIDERDGRIWKAKILKHRGYEYRGSEAKELINPSQALCNLFLKKYGGGE